MLWFRAKRYGWGWFPCSWQGWVVLLVAVALMIDNVVWVLRNVPQNAPLTDVLAALAPTLVVVVLLIVICALTGEKPRWRWGGK